jgi:hypothetical protein
MPAQLIRMSHRPSAEGLLYVDGHRCDRVRRGHVTLAGQRPAPGQLDQFYGVRARRDVGNGDVHAVLGETFRECLADAFRSAGDDGDFVLVAFGHVFTPCSALILRSGPKDRVSKDGAEQGLAASIRNAVLGSADLTTKRQK